MPEGIDPADCSVLSVLGTLGGKRSIQLLFPDKQTKKQKLTNKADTLFVIWSTSRIDFAEIEADYRRFRNDYNLWGGGFISDYDFEEIADRFAELLRKYSAMSFEEKTLPRELE